MRSLQWSSPLSSEYAPGGTSLVDVKDQPGDVQFVIEKLISLDHTGGDSVTKPVGYVSTWPWPGTPSAE